MAFDLTTETAPELARREEYAALMALLQDDAEVPFVVRGEATSPSVEQVLEGLRRALCATGRCREGADDEEARLVINLTSCERPAPHRRRSRAVFVVSLLEGPDAADPLKACYPYLIRTLSNVLLYIVPPSHAASGAHGGGEEVGFLVHFITPERGHARLACRPGGEEAFFRDLARRLVPIAASHLVIENEFYDDLPPELWDGDEHTRAFYDVGQRLDRLRLLPAPFDLEELLPPEDLRHLRRLYKMGGLSHGNMSERLDEKRFWMSASGVDKSDMRVVGRDILLVKGFSPERLSMLLSVPPGRPPRRVSVDAIEHWMIYTEHPGVGAILHVHAWMEGVPSTDVAYPCGTVELAHAVASLIRRQPHPERCVIGLRNHGLTITGTSLSEILDRVGDRLVPQIPMA